MDGEWIINLPWKSPPLSLNQRMHHMAKYRLNKTVRQIAYAKAMASKIPDLQKCTVELVWFVNTKHRRDTDNPVATFKPLCDGLVDAGIVPDDTPEYMHKLPVRIVYRPKVDAGMHLIVREVE